MQQFLKRIIDAWKSDYGFKTFTSSAISAVIGFAFTFYNGFLGIYYSSLWNIAICVYYVLLAAVRAAIVNIQMKKCSDAAIIKQLEKRTYIGTHIVLSAINILLAIPIAIMIKGDREFNSGTIPAITMATYTTYRVTMAVYNFRKSRNNKNPFIRELRNINMIDTLVSVLLLQNTLIIVNEGKMTESMTILSIVSSTAIWLLIATITIASFTKVKKLEAQT